MTLLGTHSILDANMHFYEDKDAPESSTPFRIVLQQVDGELCRDYIIKKEPYNYVPFFLVFLYSRLEYTCTRLLFIFGSTIIIFFESACTFVYVKYAIEKP